MVQLTREDLDAGLDHVLLSGTDTGRIEMVVARPAIDERVVLSEGRLIIGEGLAGDNYLDRGIDGAGPHPEAQLTLMNSRAVDLVAGGDRDRWPLAGDQLFVDFDLTEQNAPTGTRLAVGTAVIEVSAKPHTGCAKFAARFGVDAARWANSRDGTRLRGINAVVIEAGVVKPGDTIAKLPAA